MNKFIHLSILVAILSSTACATREQSQLRTSLINPKIAEKVCLQNFGVSCARASHELNNDPVANIIRAEGYGS